LEIERGSPEFGERCKVGEVAGGEGFEGGDWAVGKGGAADLERQRIEGRGGRWVRGPAVRDWDRKRVGGGRERERKK
jgi:hypothetical protein